MRIKNVVKVMNFHSLLRVDSAKKNAEKYFEYEKGLTDFADNILNNRNLILDQKIVKINKKQKPLNIYIGNDLGFCGNFNSNINQKAIDEVDCDKIIIGKKILKNKENVMLAVTKEEYLANIKNIEQILFDSVKNERNSEINVVYNHYYNISKIELVKKQLLPLKIEKQKNTYYEDFVIEGDIDSILSNVIVLYLSYEIKIAVENSYASENVMRQSITRQSLKKLEELEETQIMTQRKIRKAKSFKKVIENYIKLINKDEGK